MKTESNAADAAFSANELAIERTLLAHDRTLMAWVRTSVSLISFGFTIYKFFEGLSVSGRISSAHDFLGSRNFALVMISIGLISLALATYQHKEDTAALRPYLGHRRPRVLSLVLAALVFLLGVIGLISVLAG